MEVDTPYPMNWKCAVKEGFQPERLAQARIRRIFLDGYGVLVFRIVIFKISSLKLQNARLLLIFTKTEAFNTACYVHNRVLVVKPHNKTPYELFRGRTPTLSFMRPFGCHVTILNTLDYLGKFDGKSDEGFFVGYSMNSKALKVYNIRTSKVEENLHIRFLEDKPIIAGDGPKWLFDIDVLTKSMNYVPVVAGTNSNDLVGTEESIGAGHSIKETGSSQDYILMSLWKDDSLFDSSLKNAIEISSWRGARVDVRTYLLGGAIDGSEANGIIHDPKFVEKQTKEDRSRRSTKEDELRLCDIFVSKEEYESHVKMIVESLKEEKMYVKFSNNMEAEQREADLEWKNQWEKVIACTSRQLKVLMKDCMANVRCNGPSIEEGVYDKVFYPSWSGYNVVWVLVKVENQGSSGLLLQPELPEKKWERITKDIIVKLPSVSSGYDAIWLLKNNFNDSIGRTYFFLDVKYVSTIVDTEKTLVKDADGADVDVHHYRSMIGSLMYLTTSRPDIIYAVCVCARFQVTPKVSYLHAVKRIFRYLKGHPKLGLWYPRDYPFKLMAYTDSDYARSSLDRKSTTGGCQFLRSRLISWQCKKQTVVATSTT
ncbi:putative ribonuclease H-like domain-containing protein [Tanacetum coccineum]